MPLPRSNFNVLTRPSGSSVYSYGRTTVLAATYGPLESKQSKALIDRARFEIHYRPKVGLPTVRERLYEEIIRNLCDTAVLTIMFPRGSIVVVVQELQDDGSIISSAVNAICLALLNCGIDMKFLFAAVTCSLSANDELMIEPSKRQQDAAKASFVFVFDSLSGAILASYTTGSFSFQHYETALKLSKVYSSNIFEYYKHAVTQFLDDVINDDDNGDDAGPSNDNQ